MHDSFRTEYVVGRAHNTALAVRGPSVNRALSPHGESAGTPGATGRRSLPACAAGTRRRQFAMANLVGVKKLSKKIQNTPMHWPHVTCPPWPRAQTAARTAAGLPGAPTGRWRPAGANRLIH